MFEQIRKAKRRENTIAVLTCVVLPLILMIALFIYRGCTDVDNWNNGICAECNVGKYELSNTVGTRHLVHYIYTCNECGHSFDSLEILE